MLAIVSDLLQNQFHEDLPPLFNRPVVHQFFTDLFNHQQLVADRQFGPIQKPGMAEPITDPAYPHPRYAHLQFAFKFAHGNSF